MGSPLRVLSKGRGTELDAMMGPIFGNTDLRLLLADLRAQAGNQNGQEQCMHTSAQEPRAATETHHKTSE
jgi:hypothetical protein